MTSASSEFAPGTGAGARRLQTRFFVLLSVATLLPYAFFLLRAPAVESRWAMAELTALVLFLGANAHVGSSFLFYAEPPIRHFMLSEGRTRFAVLPPLLVGVGALLFAVGDATTRAYAISAFWIWQVHHFTRQNHGILAFASRSEGLAPDLAERTALTLTNVAGIFGAFILTAPYDRTFLAGWGWQLHAIGLGAYAAAFLAWAISLRHPMRRRPGWRSWMLLLLMLFYLPLYAVQDPFLSVYVFLTAHGLQYLVFMAFVTRKSDLGWRRGLVGLLVASVGFGLGIQVLQAGSLDTPAGRAMLGAAFGVIVWHFLLDARIWRLGEPFQRRTMTDRFDFLLDPERVKGRP